MFVLTFLERTEQINFQADDLYTEMIRKLVAIVLTPGSEEFNDVIRNHEFKANYNYSNTFEVTLPDQILPTIAARRDEKEFCEKVFSFVKKLVNYLEGKKFFHNFLSDVKFLAPKYIFQEGSIKKIIDVAKYFDLHNQPINSTTLFEELTLFVAPNNQLLFNEISDIDKFYIKVEQEGKSPELFKLFRLVSTVSISNAEVERNFSRSKHVITKYMSNLQEENFNARKQIISGMKFFGDSIEDFTVSTTLVRKVNMTSSVYKRKLEEMKLEDEANKKRKRSDDQVALQIRLTDEAAKSLDDQMEVAITEAGKIEKEMQVEQKGLTNFFNCMASSKDGARIQELVQQSKLSTNVIAQMHEDLKKIQTTILELQAKKLSRKSL